MPARRPAETAAGVRLRSLLFVPGDRPERIAKAHGSGADALILDLEDSVSLSRKSDARAAVAGALRVERTLPLFVRINALDSEDADADLVSVIPGRPDAIVLPKAGGPDSVLELERRLEALGDRNARILPIATETPAAIFQLGEYRRANARLAGLTWGAEDLAAAIGARSPREADGRLTAPYELIRTLALMGAHAADVPAIETVYLDFRDLDGLAAYAARGARDGFSGMMAIHPSQIPVINAAFTPTDEALAWARRVIAAFEAQPEAGVLALDGVMIDAPHLKQARRTVDQGVLSFHSRLRSPTN